MTPTERDGDHGEDPYFRRDLRPSYGRDTADDLYEVHDQFDKDYNRGRSKNDYEYHGNAREKRPSRDDASH